MRVSTNTQKMQTPIELTNALEKSPIAKKYFNAIPPSHKREYIKCIVEAKKEETRKSRAAKAVTMMEQKAANKN